MSGMWRSLQARRLDRAEGLVPEGEGLAEEVPTGTGPEAGPGGLYIVHRDSYKTAGFMVVHRPLGCRESLCSLCPKMCPS